jgi:hypothetical protein
MTTTMIRLADQLREALRLRDNDLLEAVALKAGSYEAIRRVAITADVELDELEEALGRI